MGSCNECGLRARYDRKPKSILGRIWKWHTGFCPGWKSYIGSLPAEEQEEFAKKYR